MNKFIQSICIVIFVFLTGCDNSTSIGNAGAEGVFDDKNEFNALLITSTGESDNFWYCSFISDDEFQYRETLKLASDGTGSVGVTPIKWNEHGGNLSLESTDNTLFYVGLAFDTRTYPSDMFSARSENQSDEINCDWTGPPRAGYFSDFAQSEYPSWASEFVAGDFESLDVLLLTGSDPLESQNNWFCSVSVGGVARDDIVLRFSERRMSVNQFEGTWISVGTDSITVSVPDRIDTQISEIQFFDLNESHPRYTGTDSEGRQYDCTYAGPPRSVVYTN